MKKNSDGYFRETFTFEGKRYDVTAKTERDLWRKVDEKKRQLEDGVDKISANMPVSKWIEKYLEFRLYPKFWLYPKFCVNPVSGVKQSKRFTRRHCNSRPSL